MLERRPARHLTQRHRSRRGIDNRVNASIGAGVDRERRARDGHTNSTRPGLTFSNYLGRERLPTTENESQENYSVAHQPKPLSRHTSTPAHQVSHLPQRISDYLVISGDLGLSGQILGDVDVEFGA